jgi:aminoglycoside phosphotransferase (APT) family kinase protein
VNVAARDWVSRILDASEVREIRSLTFGITSDLRLLEADGRPLVLRRYLDDALLQQLPELVSNEANALKEARQILGDLVPEPVALDPTGAAAGYPALLMTYLPGVVLIHDLDADRLAVPLAALHLSAVPAGLPGFDFWFEPGRIAVPGWTSAPRAWTALLEHVRGPEPECPVVFLHRDFHPGNLLWHDGELVGLVDWASSCQGPRAVDVAHTRANLALVDGVGAADRFLKAYTALMPSHRHDAWWDGAELFTWCGGDFSGVLAFNAFGADLNVELLRSRADDYAEAIAASLPS